MRPNKLGGLTMVAMDAPLFRTLAPEAWMRGRGGDRKMRRGKAQGPVRWFGDGVGWCATVDFEA